MTPAVLHILMSLAAGDRHGLGIKEAVDERTGGGLRLGPGTLYEGLHRLEDSGWVVEVEGGADEDGRRRFYRLTVEGRKAMEAELSRLDEIVRHARAGRLMPRASDR
jgi:DNA-binding PadR family transcriptional regulator